MLNLLLLERALDVGYRPRAFVGEAFDDDPYRSDHTFVGDLFERGSVLGSRAESTLDGGLDVGLGHVVSSGCVESSREFDIVEIDTAHHIPTAATTATGDRRRRR